VRLFHHGEADSGALYMVFEHVPGRDLDAYAADAGRLESHAVVQIVRQVLMSLAEAHAEGLIHRDLKPQNIRVYETEANPLTIKVLDFGIARATDYGHPSITKTGELIGTPRYMSPEQLTSKPLTPTSDIYSLGLVAFELLHGTQVLHGNRWGDQLERLRSGYLFGSEEAARFDQGLMKIVQRMTARAAEDRYPSARAVLAALESRDDATESLPQNPAGSTDALENIPTLRRAPNRRRLTWPILAVGVVVAAVAAAAFQADEIEPPTSSSGVRPLGGLVRNAEPGSPAARDVSESPSQQNDVGADDAEWRALADPILSDGCGATATAGLSVTENGVVRYVPRTYDPNHPHPMFVLLHTDYESPRSLFGASGLQELSDRERILVVMPTDPTPTRGGKNWRNASEDLAIVRAAFAAASNELCVDLGRVYLVMTGDGARIGLYAMCEPWVRAAAVNSWLQDRNDVRGACPDHAIPLIWLNPKDSTRLKTAEGGVGCNSNTNRVSQTQLEKIWGERHGCVPESQQSYRDDEGTCRTHQCDVPFETCMTTGGEGWPNTDTHSDLSILAAFCDEPEPPPTEFATEARIWDFFSALPPWKPGL
jgi:serine/threonine protein kinase